MQFDESDSELIREADAAVLAAIAMPDTDVLQAIEMPDTDVLAAIGQTEEMSGKEPE